MQQCGAHRSRYQYVFSFPGSAPGIGTLVGEKVEPSRALSGCNGYSARSIAHPACEWDPEGDGIPQSICPKISNQFQQL